MNYTDIEFEEEFIIVPPHEPMIGWVLVDEAEALELQEDHLKSMRIKAVQKKFHEELIKVSTMTGKSIGELSGAWADSILKEVKKSGHKITEVGKIMKERIYAMLDKKLEPEIVLNPYAYRDLEPCFPPARVV